MMAHADLQSVYEKVAQEGSPNWRHRRERRIEKVLSRRSSSYRDSMLTNLLDFPSKDVRRLPDRHDAILIAFGESGHGVMSVFPFAISKSWMTINEPLTAPITDVVERACNLYNEGLKESACDLVFEVVDDLLARCQFSTLDSILIESNLEECPTEVLMSLLSITRAGASKLPSYPRFLAAATTSLLKREGFDRRAIQCLLPR